MRFGPEHTPGHADSEICEGVWFDRIYALYRRVWTGSAVEARATSIDSDGSGSSVWWHAYNAGALDPKLCEWQ